MNILRILSNIAASFAAMALPLTAVETANLGQLMQFKTVSTKLASTSTLTDVDLGGEGKHSAALLYLDVSFAGSLGSTVTATGVQAFCTDLFQGIDDKTTYSYYAVPATAGSFPLSDLGVTKVEATRLLALEYLYGAAFGTAANYYATISSWSSAKLAGFQTAIWEIVHDDYTNRHGSYDFSLRTGEISNNHWDLAYVSYANAFLSTVRSDLADGVGTKLSLVVLTSSTSQDLLLPYDPAAEAPPIPEPSTYALFGAASMAGLAAYRRFRKR